ncbi:Pentatricopeptide repeat [Dillenia turbinata]|uniref:Pentatricopeptide repeat n=1 Tax=Dillenia turbinata TaxID=194707 RepID=A0AAN8VF70_9MAGN
MGRKLLLHPSLSQALSAFTNISQLKQVHAHVLVSGLAHDDFTSSRILACAAVSPVADVTYAEMIFDHTKCPPVFMFNTMIMAFERISQPLKCISLYIRMLRNQIQPDKFTYPFLLRSCSISNAPGVVEQIHCHVVKFGLDSDVFVLNNIISMYTKCGGLNCARRLFEEFPTVVDVVSWTSLLTGYSTSGEIDVARQIFDEMPCKNTVSWNAMISGYVQCGRINEAWRLFSEMPEKDTASWSAMVSGYSQCGMCTEALKLFKEMVAAAVVPNDPALVSAVSACAQLRALEEGKWLHDYIERENFHVNVTLGTALIDMYGKCGSIEKALYVFNSMPERNVMSWNSVIASLAFRVMLDSTVASTSRLGQAKTKAKPYLVGQKVKPLKLDAQDRLGI